MRYALLIANVSTTRPSAARAATTQIITDRASWIGAIDTKRVTIDPFNTDVWGTDNISPTNTHFITIGKA